MERGAAEILYLIKVSVGRNESKRIRGRIIYLKPLHLVGIGTNSDGGWVSCLQESYMQNPLQSTTGSGGQKNIFEIQI